jgi:hypothetical protein
MGCLVGLVVAALGVGVIIFGSATAESRAGAIVIGALLIVAAFFLYLWIEHEEVEQDRKKWTQRPPGRRGYRD